VPSLGSMPGPHDVADFCEPGIMIVPQAMAGDRAQACREALPDRIDEPGLDRLDEPD